MRILAAVKYVPLEEIGVLQEAGVTLVGENRAQELEEKATQYPDFDWHFIGQLQSRKVKQIVPHVSLIHSVASESALQAARDPRHAGHRDPDRGQRRRRGRQGGDRARTTSRAILEESPCKVIGLMTMPPFTEHPGGQPAATSRA